VLGRRATEAGQAILTAGEVSVVRLSVADPEPYELTTRNTATAQQGAVGADLARIRNADLLTSRNELNDVVLTVDDGTGPVDILLRAFLGTDASFFNPDSVRVREATGLLVATMAENQLRWRLTPRATTDIRVEREPPRRP
jgi:hypothetical protein